MTGRLPEAPGRPGPPLAEKLGVRPSFRVKTRNAPTKYRELLEPLPQGVVLSSRLRPPVDLWHLFARDRGELERRLPSCLAEIRPGGSIWVSWPKKSSGVPSEIGEGDVREVALPLGLVDVKVCSVDETWSGLKLVIRKTNRR